MFRYLLSILSLLCMIVSSAVADLASVSHVNTMRDNVQAKIDSKAQNDNYTSNMVLQTDGSGNVVATTVGTDLLADGAIETVHLADGAVTNADLAGMIDITKLNLGTLPTSGKHIMIWNAETQKYVFERYATSILPDGYTQLESLTWSGQCYFNTGIVPHEAGWEIEFEGAFGATAGGPNCAWGFMGASTLPRWQFATYQGTFLATPNATATQRPVADTNNHIFYSTIYNNDEILYAESKIDGMSIYFNILQDPAEYTANILPIGIGARTRHASTFDGYCPSSSSIKWWKATLNGVIQMHLIPAKRNSDSVIGMYDTVSGTFFTNDGTGEFIAGPEI